jgi:Copper transport outer membrane protein, MctB
VADGIVFIVIDFKYHVVSIVAVFLALAVGIVLGTNVLSGDVLKNLKSQTNDLRKQAQDLRTQNQQQQDQITNDQNFLQGIEPLAVEGRLSGQRIAVISVPDAPKEVRDNAVKTLTDAGAVVTAQVEIDPSYVDPTQATTLDELLKTLGAPEFDPTPAGDVSARAAASVASALVATDSTGAGFGSGAASAPPASSTQPASSTPSGATKSSSASAHPTKSADSSAPADSSASADSSAPTGASFPPAGATGVDVDALDATSAEALAGLAKAGFIKIDQQPEVYADLAVVVGAAADSKTPTPTPSSGTSFLDLIAALQHAGAQAVVIGPSGSADPGGLVAQVRADNSLSKAVSSIDDADSQAGLIAMVLALSAQESGSIGQYGTGQGAGALVPTVSPTPAAVGAS